MSRHIILFACGHWTYESTPDGFDITTPSAQTRVCTVGADGNPDCHRKPEAFGGGHRYPLSGQGLALVPVLHYLPDPRP